MNPFLIKLTACLFLVLPASGAVDIGGVELPERFGDLKLQGAGVLRKGFVFKIYVGALYLQDASHAKRVLSEVPKRLDIHYFHYTPKKHMIGVANKTLKQNLADREYEALLPKIRMLHDAFVDGKKGSCASIVYRPGEGLTYLFDGNPVITVAGDDFANAYFRVWLGDPPSSRTMKEALLGEAKERK